MSALQIIQSSDYKLNGAYLMVSLVVQLQGYKDDNAVIHLSPSATVQQLKTCLGAEKNIPASELSIICRGIPRQARSYQTLFLSSISPKPQQLLSSGLGIGIRFSCRLSLQTIQCLLSLLRYLLPEPLIFTNKTKKTQTLSK